jgi:hypothetical protein
VCCGALALAGCGGQSWTKAGGTTGSTVASNAPAGSGQHASAAQAVLLHAIDTTNAANSAHFAMTITTAGFSGTNGTITAAGALDFKNTAADMTMHASAAGASISFEIRYVRGVLYTNEGGGWQSTALPSGLGSTTTSDPTNYLEYLRGVADDVKESGHESVRGVSTTKYAGTLDLQHALARSSSMQLKQSVQALLSEIGDITFPFSAWIDTQGHLRKLTMTMDFSSVAARLGVVGMSPKVELTMEMYDFGKPVTITAPSGVSASTATGARTRAQDRAVQSDLRNALTAEKTYYTDSQAYSSDAATMKQIEPSLGWGTTVRVHVGYAGQAVCLGDKSASGTNFVLADVAAGQYAGTYYGTNAHCPAGASPAALAKLGQSW